MGLKSLWRYASYRELARLCIAFISAIAMPLVTILIGHRLPVSVYIVGGLEFVNVVAIRFGYRGIRIPSNIREKAKLRTAS